MLNRARRGRRVALALAGAVVAAGVWTVGPPEPEEAAAGPYFGLMCSDVTNSHFDRLGDTITCIESLGGHSPRRHVNSWRLCVAAPGGNKLCRTSTSSCPWRDGHTPPSSSGSCGHSCNSVWRGYRGISGSSCSFVSHYDTPHVHVGFKLGTRTRRSCPSGQHRDSGSGSCHGHPRPTCTADGTYTAISGNGHTTRTTAICEPPPCPSGQHRHTNSNPCHSHPRPRCTADGTYTAILGNGHTTGTTRVCRRGPTPCPSGQHRDGGSGSCHSHPRPTCTADGTYTAISGNGHTTRTTAICGPTPCPSGQHRDGGSGSCHSHPRPTCTADGTYTAISGNGHTTRTTAICGPTPCPSGQHRDGGSGSCHSHPRPTCTADGTYTAISGNGHTTGTTAICGGTPDPDPDLDPPCSTGLSLSESERLAFLADLRWETLVDIKPQGPPGERWPPHPDVPGGSEFLVVADSPVWTVIDSAAWSVPSLDGCVWEATDVEVVVTQLLPWRAGDRLDIEDAAEARPGAGFDTYLARWDRLSAIQRSQAQQHHPGGGVSHTCDFEDATDPDLAKSRCSWELPWAGVWNWSVSACFEGVTSERTYEECAVLDSGVEWFLNIVDYTQQITLSAGGPAGE